MGPLHGIRVIEVAGLGPAPFAAMLLADMGAEVIRVDRADRVGPKRDRPSLDLLSRGRRSVGVDLKHPEGVAAVLRMVAAADVLLEGFRPGVMERLGLGPEACLSENPKLIYGRMTGWGQDGPLAEAAGHDINYIALAGVLAHLGRRGEPPTPPINLVGDFGGGGMLLAFGVVCGLLECGRSGQGQVVDAAMVDGSALLMTMMHGLSAMGRWSDRRGENLLDTGAHFYDTYETSDGRYISVGAIEPQFYAEFLGCLGLTSAELGDQLDPDAWPLAKARVAARFKEHTLAEWCERMEGSDVCFAPVLTMGEAAEHPHNKARGTFVEVAGVRQPAPAPRFSRTPGGIDRPPPRPGADTRDVLASLGFDQGEIDALEQAGAVR